MSTIHVKIDMVKNKNFFICKVVEIHHLSYLLKAHIAEVLNSFGMFPKWNFTDVSVILTVDFSTVLLMDASEISTEFFLL